ncbi:ParA family protein [Streptomyces aidingensis]|uniref:Chromosome partitioning protein n=1 Tax=Streptomyces aidingensis TaxID=910347 RepID=A0A1I1UTP4_9ACTN|nr:ParA family protein [Streptomyces aidingensis]SFD74137.1 chromosome partitioning protein [Streptomyces aidingensis]
MSYITVVINQKGGIGKSMIAVQLAAVYAEILANGDADPTVAVVSIDPQGTSIEWAEKIEKAGREVPFRVLDASNNIANLRRLRKAKADIVIVDTPGFLPLAEDGESIDPLGDGPVGDALRAVLDIADDVIVPLEPDPAGFNPTRTTIEKVIKPRDLPYGVVISNWEPRDGKLDLERTQNMVLKREWNLYNSTIRHFRLHARAIADGLVCTQYQSSHTATKAKQDFLALALEHQLRRQQNAARAV